MTWARKLSMRRKDTQDRQKKSQGILHQIIKTPGRFPPDTRIEENEWTLRMQGQ